MKPPETLVRYIHLKLAALGQPTGGTAHDQEFIEMAGPLLRNSYQKDQRLGWPLCPVDARIQAYLDDLLKDIDPAGATRLPANAFVLDQPGLARAMSFPLESDFYASPYLKSYRTQQGVIHNPKSDRRTTHGLFHIAEGGLPVPDDKTAVPLQTFAALLARALQPPQDVLALPFTSSQSSSARLFVSLLLRPLVCPATDRDPAKSMELRFFAPGSLISNLDFVESIFGNGGDPFLPENDAALDVEHWTGHTGCVILAPHIVGLKKKDMGLPHIDQATERQRQDKMCWKNADELYNDGNAFKVACRDSRGIMVTIIADNYFGYCKKEVKTQISFAANLFGLAEEEHAGGALAYPTYILGEDFYADRSWVLKKTTFEQAMDLLGDRVERMPGRYAVDRRYPDIFYVPENSAFNVREGLVKWAYGEGEHSLPLRGNDVYILPSGYKIRLEKQPRGHMWRLVGSRPDGTFCHKPCTVSGGGKSEISKSIAPMIQSGPIFVKDFQKDLDQVEQILQMDFSAIYKQQTDDRVKRPFLSLDRSLGSVVKLLTPAAEYTDEYNTWLRNLPQTIRQIVFRVKRYYRPEWGAAWREHFTVDRIDGYLGHELKFDDQKLQANYLRVGFDPNGAWRMNKLRPDFNPADKVQMEDDITVSVVVPRERLSDLNPAYPHPSVKLVANCEAFLFQRPDDAIHRGYDAQAEADLATPGTFLSNFEPFTPEQARALIDRVTEFDQYTEPMKNLLKEFIDHPHAEFVASSAHPRLVNGKPSKNPRYLQKRPDRVQHRQTYIAEIGARINLEIPAHDTVHFPVRAVLAGRRNNPPQPEIKLPSLAVYNPLHYQELPELFMDFLSSLTGKSPSTTGFGSEGALTKGPFNALWPVVDMNNALAGMILTGYAGFTSAAGNVGPSIQVEHDISMLIPELWCRLEIQERDPAFLIQSGYFEKIQDFDFEGQRVLASRLGYRVTPLFADRFLGRIFEMPNNVFTDDMFRPEKQDLGLFVEGVQSIIEAHTRVARQYIADGSVEAACPPLKALIQIMANGNSNGMTVEDPRFRQLFTREALLASPWYQERLRTKQQRDINLWKRHLYSLRRFQTGASNGSFDVAPRLTYAQSQLARVNAPDYLKELIGTIGADPFSGQIPNPPPALPESAVPVRA